MIYVLDEHGEPVQIDTQDVHSMTLLVNLFDSNDRRRVAWTKRKNTVVSTVFLAIDHGFGRGAPVLWETMVRKGKDWGDQERYRGLKEAIAGHKQKVAEVFGSKPPETEWGKLVMLVEKVPRVVGPSAWHRLLGPEFLSELRNGRR